MSDEATLIDPSGIPHFIGDLSTLDVDVMLLTANAAQFRASGADIHTTFQGLGAVYHAPEAGDLLSSTEPVRTKSDAFADGLEKVVSALSEYSAEVQPLVDRLETLKADATAFVASVSGDEDWRKDQDKVGRNNSLWREVNHAVAAFQAAERRAYNKIMGLIGGQKLTVDDGSHGDTMYGYRADDLDHARQTPWGAPAEREYEGWDWLRHEAGQVWEGIWTDGVIGTIHGVGTLFGSDGSHAAGEAWRNLAKLGTASALTSATFGTWWLVPEDQQPTWLRESREAHKGLVKGLVAWDTWQTNPARAAGAVTFNVLTILGTEGAGTAARTGAAARTLSVVGKVGRAIDPMTYAGKAGKFAFVKVGDAFSKLKDLRTGATYALPEAPLAERPPAIPEHAAELLDDAGHRVYLDTRTGDVLNADGTVRQHAAEAAHEPSAYDRSTRRQGDQDSLTAVGAHGGNHSAGQAGHAHGGMPTPHEGGEHGPGNPRHEVGALDDHASVNHGDDGHGHAASQADGAHTSGGTGATGGSGGTSPHGRGVWPAREDIPGPAAGQELKRPNSRHTISGAGSGEIKERNSLILRGYSDEIDRDIAAIAEGKANLAKDGNRYEINGRTYGVEPGGRVYPDSGPGIVNLDRNEYAALQQLVKAKGDISAAPQLTRNPRFVNNPQAVQKALAIYNGTYR
ncbi:hypothetical protein ACF1AO_13190 [Streptomyces longwoodensis]|uniref:hypothetical protein n=1 Tax=Streptomyces longwoodensis TaxID=68231 RepID=UPI0036FA68E3